MKTSGMPGLHWEPRREGRAATLVKMLDGSDTDDSATVVRSPKPLEKTKND